MKEGQEEGVSNQIEEVAQQIQNNIALSRSNKTPVNFEEVAAEALKYATLFI